MSLLTNFLKLFKYDPTTDKDSTFNITKALNENWDKIDAKVEEINDNKVDKVEGKGLSANDYTLEEKIKLGGISKQATKVETSVINGQIKIDGVQAKVYDDSEISNRVGPLASLLTLVKTSIVNAINSLKTEVDEHKADNTSAHGINLKANKIQENWIAPTLLNGWVNFNSAYSQVGYMKDEFGFVHLRGIVSGGTINTAIFRLPVGYRPDRRAYFVATSNLAYGQVLIEDGNVYPIVGATNNFSLDDIIFKAGA